MNIVFSNIANIPTFIKEISNVLIIVGTSINTGSLTKQAQLLIKASSETNETNHTAQLIKQDTLQTLNKDTAQPITQDLTQPTTQKINIMEGTNFEQLRTKLAELNTYIGNHTRTDVDTRTDVK